MSLRQATDIKVVTVIPPQIVVAGGALSGTVIDTTGFGSVCIVVTSGSISGIGGCRLSLASACDPNSDEWTPAAPVEIAGTLPQFFTSADAHTSKRFSCNCAGGYIAVQLQAMSGGGGVFSVVAARQPGKCAGAAAVMAAAQTAV